MLKVALLGDTGVGKSALVNQCTNCGFSDRYRATTRASARIQRLDVDGVSQAVQIWDCAGNERLHTLAPQFFHDVDICILVYDTTSRRSFQRLDHWLAMFRGNAGDGKVIVVVGTKADLTDRREVDEAEVLEWCTKHGTVQSVDEREPLPHFIVSAKANIGIMDFLLSAVQAAASKERIIAPPPPRAAMDGMRRGSPMPPSYRDPRGFHQQSLYDGGLPPPTHQHHHHHYRYGQPPPGHGDYSMPSPTSHLYRGPGLNGGPEIVVLKQKVANLESQLAKTESSMQESELAVEALKRQLCDVRNQELMGKLEMQERLDQLMSKLQKKDEENNKMVEHYTKHIAHLEAQLSQRDAHLAFGADADLEEENLQLQEENANLKDALRRSQALVQELQVQLQKARARPAQADRPASGPRSPASVEPAAQFSVDLSIPKAIQEEGLD